MDQVISFSPVPSVLVWANRILPTPVLYTTLVWSVLLLFTPQSQRKAMFLFLLGTAVLIGPLLYSWQTIADLFMMNARSGVTNLTERLPDGSLASSWYRTLIVQSVLLMTVRVWMKYRTRWPSRQLANDRMPYGVGLGLLMATVAYVFDPFATRLPREVVEKGISLNELFLARPDGSRISISTLASLSEYFLFEPTLSERPVSLPAKRSDNKEVSPNTRALPPVVQAVHGPPVTQPRNTLGEVHAKAPNIHHTRRLKASIATQVWVLWRADSRDCIKLLEQMAQHQKHFPEAWRHTRLIIINEGDDILTLTRALVHVQSLTGEIVWDKRQQLLASLKLQVLPITLLLDAKGLLKGIARVQDYKIGRTRF
ncbi:hypothetical protein LMG33818_002305 [Halomonadaceae bacterium LMG 33818]